MSAYAAYIVAEKARASVVLAVVAYRFFLSRKSATFFSPGVRLQAYALWNTIDFVINGLVFVLIGLQLPSVLSGLHAYSELTLITYAAAVSANVIMLRLLWIYPSTYVAEFIRRRVLQQMEARVPAKQIFVTGWTGMRGVLSLAAALSVPELLANGQPFPGRNLIIFLTFSGILVGELAQSMLYQSDDYEEQDFLDALQAASEKYLPTDFHFDLLKEHVAHDIEVLEAVLAKVKPITPEHDAKLNKLLSLLPEETLNTGKRLIFTQYSDTADYLYANLNKNNRADVDVISGNASKSKFRLVGRFSPHANPDYKPQAGESELNTVIATDVLSEGLNMQDCDTIINYDLHWNPVRLIQRFGRIDRIGSTHNKVFGLNFLPEDALDRNLGLKDRLKRRIAEIQGSISLRG